MFTPLTPLRCLHRAMDVFGHLIGVVCGDREFTYREFGERCQRLASALRKRGIQPGDRVAYLSFNNHQLLEGYYGVVQAGAIVAPLNVRLTPAELTAILHHAGARMLIFENDFAPVADKIREGCPTIECYVSLGDKVGPANVTYEELIAEEEPERVDIFKIDENSIAELFYTSGSTGVPKGVMLSHRTLYLHALAVTTIYVQLESMVYLHTIPFFHANGWGGPQALTYLGVKQVMVRRFDPPAVLEMVERYKATDMYLVPTMANALLNVADRDRYDLSSLRRIFIGGAASSPALMERVEKNLGGQCLSGYGLTETSPLLTAALPRRDDVHASDQERYRRQAMTGWPVIGNEVRVVDQMTNDVPRDMKTIGEIVARGDHVMDGYYNEPKQTAASFCDGWFRTGDMAVWDEEGYILIVDRKKEIIVSGGENISSLEIEKAIVSHPAVFECAVVAAPDDKWGERPAAIVVLKPGHDLTFEALQEFLAEKLARFKLPTLVEFRHEQLPKSGAGKVRKLDLRNQFWAGIEKRVQG